MARAGYKWITYAQSLGLRGPAQSTAVVLASYADDQGVAWPSVATLMLGSGYSRSATQSGLRILEQLGIIEVERGVGRGNGNRYHLTLKVPSDEQIAALGVAWRPGPTVP